MEICKLEHTRASLDKSVRRVVHGAVGLENVAVDLNTRRIAVCRIEVVNANRSIGIVVLAKNECAAIE